MLSLSASEYQIGIICALPKELKAVNAVLDEEHEPLKNKDKNDHNSYVLGRIGQHNVVAAGLPAGVYGTTSAASVGKDMLRTFPQLRFGLLVGIAGGIPDVQANRDIRLGDIVVSQPDATHGGIVQYDLGKLLSDGQFEQKGTFGKPPRALLAALTSLQASSKIDSIAKCLKEIDEKKPYLKEEGYRYQGSHLDQLHCAKCEPFRWWWILWTLVLWLWPLWRCEVCRNGKVIRPLRAHTTPVVHYGTIASGNTLLKNAIKRDQLAKEFGALCIETEAAGLDDYPCLVVRGICDYADAFKNDIWQDYAALTAAAFAKLLLGYVSPQAAKEEKLIRQMFDQFDQHFQRQYEHNTRMEEYSQQQEIHYYSDQYRDCHRAFGISDYERQKNINPNAIQGTCRWVLDHPRYRTWIESPSSDLLWVSADPGCGKSVLSKSLVDDWLASRTATTKNGVDKPFAICYFFFKDNEDQSSLSIALCAIIHQLFTHQPILVRNALFAFNKYKEEELTKNVNELWRILQRIATDPSMQPAICVLDALDECWDADRQLLIDFLCQFYEDSVSDSESQGCLKWLVTSRPHDDIRGNFGQLPSKMPSIHLRGEEENDQIRDEVNLVIDRRMTELGHRLGLADQKMEEITQQLRKMENRTYLWLHLVLENIETTLRRSARPNQVKISSLPATVDQAYEGILKRIVNAEEKQYAKLVLTIIVGAPRPLTVAEMALAFDVATLSEPPRSLTDLTVDADGLIDRVRDWCSLFVFVKHNQFFLIHETAKDFLRNPNNEVVLGSSSWKYCLHSADIDREMARICVFFLCLVEFDSVVQSGVEETQTDYSRLDLANTAYTAGDDVDRPGVETFFLFTSEHWADYVRQVETDLADSVQSKIRELYGSSNARSEKRKRMRCQALFRFDDEYEGDDIHLASYNGHYLALRHILNTNPGKLNQVDSFNRTPLVWAVQRGFKELVDLLVAQPDIDVNFEMPLHWAARYGHAEILRSLLTQPSLDINIGEPLLWAVHFGSTEVLELLLTRPDLDINLGKPLARAARYGFKDMVELLLAVPGIDINLGMPLAEAARGGHRFVMELLLLAQPSSTLSIEEPLYWAARNGFTAIVELLLTQAGPEIDLAEPLYVAARVGHTEVVELLLLAQQGLHVNLGESLVEAACADHQDIVRLLLTQQGIDVNFAGPIYKAAHRGHKEVVQLLLAHRDINVDHGELLSWAERGGHKDMIELLLAPPETEKKGTETKELEHASGTAEETVQNQPLSM